MPDTQRTIEDQAARNRRGQQLLDRRRAITGDPYRKLLLLILDDHIGPKASYPISFSLLAEETEMHETTVRRKAAELKSAGLIDYTETELGSAIYEFRIVRSNVSELADEQCPLQRRRRGRPKKDEQPAENKCTPQNINAGCKNDLPTANLKCTVQLAPYIERPSNAISTNPITHAIGEQVESPARSTPSKEDADGNGVRKNASGGWDAPIEAWQLTKIEHVQARYLEAVRKGWVTPSEQDQVNFFALSRACAKIKSLKNPAASFTFFLKRKKWEVIRQEDDDAARKAISQLRPPPSNLAGLVALKGIPVE